MVFVNHCAKYGFCVLAAFSIAAAYIAQITCNYLGYSMYVYIDKFAMGVSIHWTGLLDSAKFLFYV